jgi:hypothetical protein
MSVWTQFELITTNFVEDVPDGQVTALATHSSLELKVKPDLHAVHSPFGEL